MGNSSTRNIIHVEDEAVNEDNGGEDERPFVAEAATHQHGNPRAQPLWTYTTTAETDTGKHNYHPQLNKTENINTKEEKACLVAEANHLTSAVVSDSKQLSKPPSSDTFKDEAAAPCDEETHIDPVYVCNTTHVSSQAKQQQPSQLDDHIIQQEEAIDNPVQCVTPESLYNDIALGKINVELFTCAVFVCGTEACNKTDMLHSFLSKAIKLFNEKQERNLFKKSPCLSLCECIILGSHPYNKFTWLKSSNSFDEIVLSLSFYLSRLCKTRKQEPHQTQAFHDLIKFNKPVPGETINIQPQEVATQISCIYDRLQTHWKRLKDYEPLQAVSPHRVCLINIFDVGHSRAAQDLLPFLSQYCKQALTVVCYDVEHEEKLQIALEKKIQEDRQTPKYMLLQQLCGVHKKNPVALIALGDTNTRDKSGLKKIAENLRAEINVDEVTAVSATEDSIDGIKTFIEKHVMVSPFNCSKPVQYFMLRQRIQNEAKSFWMKKKEIKALYDQYSFPSGDTLDDVLMFFTQFGCLLYMHDVPALREYVIVDIVKFSAKVEELYQSDESTAKYGLLKYRNEEDSRVIFDFLTTLGIAAEVKSSQITQLDGLNLETAMNYYYIPNIRKPQPAPAAHFPPTQANPQNHATKDLDLLQEHKCTAKVLQVSLLKHLLIHKECLLIPTEDVNMTAIRLFLQDAEQNIEFVDDGSQFVMYLKNEKNERDRRIAMSEAFSLMKHTACPFFKQKCKMTRPSFVDGIPDESSNKSQKLLVPKMMVKLAKHIAKQDKMKQEEFSTKLGFEQKHIENKMQEEDEEARDVIHYMLDEFQRSKGTSELIKHLIEYDKELDQILHKQT